MLPRDRVISQNGAHEEVNAGGGDGEVEGGIAARDTRVSKVIRKPRSFQHKQAILTRVLLGKRQWRWWCQPQDWDQVSKCERHRAACFLVAKPKTLVKGFACPISKKRMPQVLWIASVLELMARFVFVWKPVITASEATVGPFAKSPF